MLITSANRQLPKSPPNPGISSASKFIAMTSGYPIRVCHSLQEAKELFDQMASAGYRDLEFAILGNSTFRIADASSLRSA